LKKYICLWKISIRNCLSKVWVNQVIICKIFLPFTVVLFFSACTSTVSLIEKTNHPLLDVIYDNTHQSTISKELLLNQIANTDVVYLGEHHNNNFHHEKQLEVIKNLVAKGLRPQIGFERFAIEQTSILINYIHFKNSPHYSAKQFDSEEWLKQKLQLSGIAGIKAWEYYGPIIQYAAENKLTLFGIDLNKNIRHQITKKGINGLTSLEKRLLYPTDFTNDNYRLLMHQNFKKGHCGWGETEYLDRLYDNWLARNDTMAMAISEMAGNKDKGPVVIILGAGHTQFNMGVYERVNNVAPHLKQLNLSFTGVRKGVVDFKPWQQQYNFNGTNYGHEYEYFWFTESLAVNSGSDLCASYLKKTSTQ
jgi:uncharacterized iron-regulated protein